MPVPNSTPPVCPKCAAATEWLPSVVDDDFTDWIPYCPDCDRVEWTPCVRVDRMMPHSWAADASRGKG